MGGDRAGKRSIHDFRRCTERNADYGQSWQLHGHRNSHGLKRQHGIESAFAGNLRTRVSHEPHISIPPFRRGRSAIRPGNFHSRRRIGGARQLLVVGDGSAQRANHEFGGSAKRGTSLR